MKNIITKKSKSLIAFFVAMIAISGCGDFLDINTDPNNPLDSPPKQILPSVEAALFESLGNGSGGMSDVTSQFVHHTVQRGPTNFYGFFGNEFDISNAWPNLYSGALKDIDQILVSAEKSNSYNYKGVALVLKAYIYSQMVDMWGKAVYFNFGKGVADPFPVYDDGEQIYPELFVLLDSAVLNLSKTSAKGISGDLVYGGDQAKWLAFTKSLKLKLYNQVRLTNLYDAAKVDALLADTKLISANSGGFRLLYNSSNNPENRHPLFKQDYVDNNANYIDPYFYLIMADKPSSLGGVLNPVLQGIQDPRVPYYFYNQLAGDAPQNKFIASAKYGNFLAIWFACYNIDPNEGFDQNQSQTKVGLYPCGGAFDYGTGVTAGVASGQNPGLSGAGYQRLYPYFADLYTRAELVLTMGAAGDHRALFQSAMEASFDEVNELAPADTLIKAKDIIADDFTYNDVEDYVNAVLAKYDAATDAGKLELILTEKWIASFGYTVDAYTDYRRTGYPIMFDPATDNNPLTILNRVYPVSLPYFTDDLQINPNAPAQRNPGTDKVFWDKN